MERNYLTHQIDKLIEENRKLLSQNRCLTEVLAVDPDMIFRYHTLDKIFEYVSPASTVLTGYPPAEFYHQPDIFQKLVDPEDYEVFSNIWLRALDGMDCPEVEFRIQKADSSQLWIAMRTWPLVNRIGKQVAIAGNIRDISQKKKLEDQIRTLEGLVPICSHCKKIRTSDSAWEEIETYLSHRSNLDFTHGLCPGCREKLFP